jgi:hypothetical protein
VSPDRHIPLKYDVEIKRGEVGVKITVLFLLGPAESGRDLRRCDPRGAARIGVRRRTTLGNHRIARRSVEIDLEYYVTYFPSWNGHGSPVFWRKRVSRACRFSCDRVERFMTTEQARDAMAAKGQRGRRKPQGSPQFPVKATQSAAARSPA